MISIPSSLLEGCCRWKRGVVLRFFLGGLDDRLPLDRSTSLSHSVAAVLNPSPFSSSLSILPLSPS